MAKAKKAKKPKDIDSIFEELDYYEELKSKSWRLAKALLGGTNFRTY